MQRVALLGGGRIGRALIGGLLEAEFEPEALAIAELDPQRRHELEEELPGVRVVPSAAWAVADAEIVVVAVKPPDVVPVLEQAGSSLGPDTLVISVAAGVRLASLEQAVPNRPVVRAMPNTPALVRRAATAISAGRHATEAHLAAAERVLGAVGVVVRVPESQLDAVTGLSGSGPAYVFLMAEALIEAGVLAGLPRETADALARETLMGASSLLVAGDDSPEALRAAVTSPGGTTAAGLHVLEAQGFRAALHDAVQAASERSREMGS